MLHQYGGDRSSTALQFRFNHDAFGVAVRVGAQIHDFGLQQDRFFKLVQIALFLGRYLDGEDIAAHGLGDELMV